MSVFYKVGTILAPTATGNQGYTGIGFQPKVVIFFSAYDNGFADLAFSFGVAQSSSKRWVIAGVGSDAAATTNTLRDASSSRCILQYNQAHTICKQADLVTLDSDGFTLNWVTANADTDMPIYYLAIGGTDIQVDVGTHTFLNNGGAQAKTGVGFKPDGLIMVSIHQATFGGAVHIANTIGIGDGVGPNAWSLNSYSRDNRPSTEIDLRLKSDSISSSRYQGANQSDADLQSMDTDGYTVQVTDAEVINYLHGYLAIKGCQIFVGSATSKTTDPGAKSTTGLGFQPGALLFLSAGHTSAISAGSSGDSLKTTIGATDGESDRCFTVLDDDAADPTISKSSQVEGEIMRFMADDGSSVVAKARLSTLDADGFTLDWTAVDSTERLFAFMAFAMPAPYSTVSLVGTS